MHCNSDDGSRLRADLYIDCSGSRGDHCRGNRSAAATEDWSHWLPCDRAVGVLGSAAGDLAPHSECLAAGVRLAMAHTAAAEHR